MRIGLSFLAIGSLASCITVYAAQPTQASPLQITVPNLKGGVEVNAGGMLTRPSVSNSNSNSIGMSPAIGASNTPANISSGINAGVGYNIPDSGNNVQMQWSHLNN